MAYYPAFDLTTVYYANKALALLESPPDHIDMHRILEAMQNLSVWTEATPDRPDSGLLRAIAILRNAEPDGDGFRWDSIKGDKPDQSWYLEQLLFGLLALSQIVEAICLGDALYYMNHPGHDSFTFAYTGERFNIYDRDGLWQTLRLTSEQADKYVDWLKTIPLVPNSDGSVNDETAMMRGICCEMLSRPFINLAGSLFETNAGNIVPATLDTHTPGGLDRLCFDERDLGLLIPRTPAHAFVQDLRLLGRMHGYLMNGLCYNVIATLAEKHYVTNAVRGPFLFALGAASSPLQKKSILAAFDAAIGATNDKQHAALPGDATFLCEDKGIAHLLFAVVLSTARDIADIIPAAYRLRDELSDLRGHLNTYGWDNHFEINIRKLVRYLAKQNHVLEEGITIGLKTLSLNVPGEWMSWLYKPFFIGEKRYLNSVVIVADQYKSLFSMSERISKLAGY